MASEKTKSLIDTAAEIAESVLPQVQTVLAAAFASDDQDADGAPASASAGEGGDSTGSKPLRKRAGTWIGLLILGGLAAVAAIVWKRLQDGSASDNWESSYTPPAPAEDVSAAEETPAEASSTEADPA